MANMRYFTECNGATVELTNVHHDGAVATTARHFTGKCPTCGERHVCSRVIQYKRHPSRHECGPRCMSAKGHSCECSCGGANHGIAA